MEFRFDGNQDYQLDAIASVVDLFDGQMRIEAELARLFAAIPNRLDLTDDALLENLRAVQARNGLPPDPSLLTIEQSVPAANGEERVSFPNFSVEMETGTGKTYVYLRTALELFQRYGLRKFVIVVPSVAVREGVLKTFQVTQKHLRELYGNLPYRYYAYDSANLSQVRQFALSNSVEFMVMTIDSFNKASNVIRQTTDRLQGETPIHLVQAARTVLILDEPQNMESELRVQALAALNPLFALRYSATHRNPYNLVYRLTPFEAYRQGLVKRIEVAGIEKVDDANRPFIRVEQVTSEKWKVRARLTVHKLMKDGTVKEQTIWVRLDDDLEAKTNRPEYAGFIVEEINPGGGFVRFTNYVELQEGAAQGADKEAVFEAQIRYTLEEHFYKHARLKSAGIKVLSLFFIDRVDNYIQEDGMIRTLFNRCFNELKSNHADWADADSQSVQKAYFAQRKSRTGEILYEDSKTGEAERDREAYDLIMKDKERLLSIEEPTSFIFSHSALREGWDNPNVFQICTLNQTASEVKKRQEIGRGVRLAVNQSGERIRDDRVNTLTVVANESYERYVSRLQSEIEEEYGAEGAPPKPPNAREKRIARLRKEYTLKPEFQELWERIKHKTRYAVAVDTDALVSDVVEELEKTEIRAPRVIVTKGRVQATDEDAFDALQVSGAKTVLDLRGRYALPDLLGAMLHLLEQTTDPVRLTQGTLLEMLRRTSRLQAAMDNPYEFATACVRLIKDKLAEQLVNGIRYEKINEWYEMTLFDDIPKWEEYLVPAERSIYDQVIVESEVERRFVEELENREDILLYVKLPNWFTVLTPIGNYNPDWAIVLDDQKLPGVSRGGRLYLVRETKDTLNLAELRPDERRKILCGEKHFVGALGVDYEVVTDARDLKES